MKKLISIFIALTVIITLVTGCSSANSRSSYETPASSTASAAPQAAAADFGKGFGAANRAAAPSAAAERYMEMEPTDDYDMAEDYDMAAESAVPPTAPLVGGGIAGPAATPVIDARKIVKNVDLQLQTMTFDTSVESVSQIAENYGGYIQNSYIEGRDMYNERGARYASFTVRVPSEQLDSFVNSIGSEFNVISKNQNSQDITETYYDSRARLDALKVQEERLIAMLEDANELEYMIQIEDKLMNVRYEIESITSSLGRMDNYVSLSTVNIYLTEVVKYEPVTEVPVTFSERISRAFTDSWINFVEFSKDFVVIAVSILPLLLLLAVIAVILVVTIRKSNKKRGAKHTIEKSQSATAYTPPVFTAEPPAGQDSQPGGGEGSDK